MNFLNYQYLTRVGKSIGFQVTIFIAAIIVMGNLNALVDYVLHPDIPYLDEEHLIVGGITVFVSAILFGIILIYVRYLNNAQASNEDLRHQIELQLNSAGEGIIGLDINGNHTAINPSAAKMLGYKVEELIGKPSHATWHHSKPDGSPYPEKECKIYAAYKNGSVCRITNEVFWRKDGTSFPVEYTSAPIYEDARLAGAVVTFNNITEQKKAEAALRESEEHFRAITESSLDAIITTDSQNNIIFCNRAAERMYGYSKEELIGQPAAQLLPERLRERNKTSFQKALKKELLQMTGKPVEACGLKKDQQEFPIEVSVTTYKIDDKVYFTAAVHDITERKLAETKIQKEVNFNKILIEASPAFFVAIASDGKTLLMNKSMLHALGYTIDEVIGKDYLSHFVPETEREILSNVFKKVVELKGSTVSENHILTKDGKYLLVEWYGTPVLNEKGEIEYFFGVGTDITEHKRVETEIREAKDFLENVYHTIGDGLIVTDEAGYIIKVNDSTIKMFEYAEQDLIGMHMAELSLEKRGKLPSVVEQVFEKGFIKNHETEYKKKDGTIFPAEINIMTLKDKEGNLIGGISSIREITDRKRSETALREAKEQLEKFIEHSLDPIIMADSKGYVVKPNKAFLDMIGYAEEEIIGKKVHSLSITETGTYESTTGELVTITEDFFKEASACIEQLIRKRGKYPTGKPIICINPVKLFQLCNILH